MAIKPLAILVYTVVIGTQIEEGEGLFGFSGQWFLLFWSTLIELSGEAKLYGCGCGFWFHVCENISREAASLRIQRDLRMYLAKKAYKDLCYSTISIETGMSGIATLQRHTRVAIMIQERLAIGLLYTSVIFFRLLDLSDNLLCGDIPFSLSKLKQLDAL
ncbi:hypothetical protein NC652_018251 [Populus alba x Populus x berolinensis]|nr:hypothetical protein NC652_018251 [Populus alba x Populus x berolinensis]